MMVSSEQNRDRNSSSLKGLPPIVFCMSLFFDRFGRGSCWPFVVQVARRDLQLAENNERQWRDLK